MPDRALSRRSALRVAAAMGSLLAAARGWLPETARAAPGEPPPESEPWPACSAERPTYCIEAFTVNGVDQLDESSPLVAHVSANASPVNGPVNRVDWDFTDPEVGSAPLSALDADVEFRLRTGRIRPDNTHASARRFLLSVSNSADTGWKVTMTGRPGLMQWADPSGDPEQADNAVAIFQGTIQDESHEPSSVGRFFEASICTSSGGLYWDNGGWQTQLSGPHLGVDGELNHGSYAVWFSQEKLQDMWLTLSEALAGKLAVTRTDGSVTTEIAADIREHEGGVYIDIPDITFSSPTFRFASTKKRKPKKKRKKNKKKKKKGKKKR